MADSTKSKIGSILKLEDFADARIPGVRKIFKYAIEGDRQRYRTWLFISIVFFGITLYNASYYVALYTNQEISLNRSYLFPSELSFPKIIMCTPTSYSFSRLLNQRSILQQALKGTTYSKNLYEDVLVKQVRNMSTERLIALLELRLDRLIVSCMFQRKPCDLDHIRLEANAEHACFSIASSGNYNTSSIGRDGGFSILLSLQAYDGIEERPGMPGGLKIIMVNTKHMNMPHQHDVVYAKTGHLNSISLIAKKRVSILNCTKDRWSQSKRQQIKMSLNQVRFYNKSHTWPCVIQNYYATKTTAILRSQVVYKKLGHNHTTSLQANATMANQLKSIYVKQVRQRDTILSKRLLRLTKTLRRSFAGWKTLECTRPRYRVRARVSISYIRGRIESLRSFVYEHLNKYEVALKYFRGVMIEKAMELMGGSNLGEAAKLAFSKGSRMLELMNEALAAFEKFIETDKTHQAKMKNIIDTLGNIDVFHMLTSQEMHNEMADLFDSHVMFGAQSLLSQNCYIANEKQILDVPFVHTGELLCHPWNLSSPHDTTCPVELACPDFDQNYLDKYNVRYSYITDKTTPPKRNIPSSVFIFCFLGIILKDMVRAYSIDFKDSYDPAFELFRLNEIAKVEWVNSTMFELRDADCRTFQACWRLSNYIIQQFSNNVPQPLRKSAMSLMKYLGIKVLGLLDSCKSHSLHTKLLFQRYSAIYDQHIIIPFEALFNKLKRFRKLLPNVRRYRPPYFVYGQQVTSLLQQFERHLEFHLDTGNISTLAHFLNRRGKIMVGQMQINTEYMQTFSTSNTDLFLKTLRQSDYLYSALKHERNRFRLNMKENVTMSVLSLNLTKAKLIIGNTRQCALSILNQLRIQGGDTLKHLDTWLINTAPLQVRARQYGKAETLDQDFVGKNFVQIEIYFEDMSEGIETEEYPLSLTAFISHIGAVGRFYMGLKVFNVAQLLGPIFVFLTYRIYLLLPCKVL